MRALLNPLYGTSYCLCDALQEENYRDAEQVVILSASSKTAIGLAFGLSQIDGARPTIIGLTSPGNVGFVEKTGSYDTVIGYDDLSLLPNKSSVLVDMSGNRAVLGAVHGALGDNMYWCHNVGLTHWDDSETKNDPAAAELIAERSAMFFAPGHIARRAKEWGAMDFNQKVASFLADGMAHAPIGLMCMKRKVYTPLRRFMIASSLAICVLKRVLSSLRKCAVYSSCLALAMAKKTS